MATPFGCFRFDPNDTFDWMMDANERCGNKVTFYFTAGGVHELDPIYSIREPRLKKLIARILERGHEVGLHGSYLSFDRPEILKQEANDFLEFLESQNLLTNNLGGRQHYLRWDVRTTPQAHASAGLEHDSSLCFAQHPGFRCGTSREYTMYDLVGRKPLPLKQRPLLVMECSVISEEYLGLGPSSQAFSVMDEIKRTALYWGGDHTLLWHNSFLETPEARELYCQLIK
tara:strand:- start:175 stop:861 length:687 start_codon:yes stop_codon:yes gene_type:complete